MSIVKVDLRAGQEYVEAVDLVNWVMSTPSDSPLMPQGELARDALDQAFDEALDVIYGTDEWRTFVIDPGEVDEKR